MFYQFKAILSTMAEQVKVVDFNQNIELVFLRNLHTGMLNRDIEPEFADLVVEHMRLDISADVNPDEIKNLAHMYAQVIFNLMINPSFRTLEPVFQRAALKGLTFTYKV